MKNFESSGLHIDQGLSVLDIAPFGPILPFLSNMFGICISGGLQIRSGQGACAFCQKDSQVSSFSCRRLRPGSLTALSARTGRPSAAPPFSTCFREKPGKPLQDTVFITLSGTCAPQCVSAPDARGFALRAETPQLAVINAHATRIYGHWAFQPRERRQYSQHVKCGETL